MSKKEALQLFGDKTIRTAWSEDDEKWYFSIIDVVYVLTDSVDASAYWRKLKERLLKEGNETVTTCHTFKMKAADGKMRQTDVADQEQLFRLIQSIPSPKAEPFKQWMAQVASERIDEMQDPEKAIDRGYEYYRRGMFVVLTEFLSVGMSIRQLNKFVHSLPEGCSQQLADTLYVGKVEFQGPHLHH